MSKVCFDGRKNNSNKVVSAITELMGGISGIFKGE